MQHPARDEGNRQRQHDAAITEPDGVDDVPKGLVHGIGDGLDELGETRAAARADQLQQKAHPEQAVHQAEHVVDDLRDPRRDERRPLIPVGPLHVVERVPPKPLGDGVDLRGLVGCSDCGTSGDVGFDLLADAGDDPLARLNGSRLDAVGDGHAPVQCKRVPSRITPASPENVATCRRLGAQIEPSSTTRPTGADAHLSRMLADEGGSAMNCRASDAEWYPAAVAMEAHLTLSYPPSCEDALCAWVARRQMKLTRVELASGRTPRQVMLTTWFEGELEHAVREAHALRDALRPVGVQVSRVKLEADLERSIPALYLEHHVKVYIEATDIDRLARVAATQRGHLSRSPRRSDGQREQRFVTQRFAPGQDALAASSLARLLDAIRVEGLELLDIERERVVYDDELSLDLGWCDAVAP